MSTSGWWAAVWTLTRHAQTPLFLLILLLLLRVLLLVHLLLLLRQASVTRHVWSCVAHEAQRRSGVLLRLQCLLQHLLLRCLVHRRGCWRVLLLLLRGADGLGLGRLRLGLRERLEEQRSAKHTQRSGIPPAPRTAESRVRTRMGDRTRRGPCCRGSDGRGEVG
jgi:hypothetical protein